MSAKKMIGREAPPRVDDMVDFVVARILDQIGVANDPIHRRGSDR